MRGSAAGSERGTAASEAAIDSAIAAFTSPGSDGEALLAQIRAQTGELARRLRSDLDRFFRETSEQALPVAPTKQESAAAERGIHMYLEKPMCRSLEEADRMVAACEKHNVKLALAHQTRYSPKLRTIRQLLEDGVIGTVLELRGRGKEDRRRGGAERDQSQQRLGAQKWRDQGIERPARRRIPVRGWRLHQSRRGLDPESRACGQQPAPAHSTQSEPRERSPLEDGDPGVVAPHLQQVGQQQLEPVDLGVQQLGGAGHGRVEVGTRLVEHLGGHLHGFFGIAMAPDPRVVGAARNDEEVGSAA